MAGRGFAPHSTEYRSRRCSLQPECLPRTRKRSSIRSRSWRREFREAAIAALAAVSTIREQQLEQILPKRLSDIFVATPGVFFQDRGDNPATAVNIRGLQDFGRVAVVVDGARQNFQRTGHTANGEFFLDSELLAAADVVRGPTANIYGSGAIGGVVSFRTKDVEDILRPGERWGAVGRTEFGTNQVRGLASLFGAVRVNPNVEFIAGGSYRGQSDYKDGNNEVVANSWQKVGSALGKLTFRPADGHEVKVGGTFQDFEYNFGQPNRGPVPPTSNQGTSVYATDGAEFDGQHRLQVRAPGRQHLQLGCQGLLEPHRSGADEDFA